MHLPASDQTEVLQSRVDTNHQRTHPAPSELDIVGFITAAEPQALGSSRGERRDWLLASVSAGARLGPSSSLDERVEGPRNGDFRDLVADLHSDLHYVWLRELADRFDPP